MNYKVAAEQIFLSSIESVLPDQLIQKQVFIKGFTLFISSHEFPLKDINRIFVIGAGKASAMMAKEIENILGDRITEGHVVVKYDHACELKYLTISEAGHPTPDNNGYLATQKILKIAEKAEEKDLIICLLSGGGSALLTDFPEGATLNDTIITNDLLTKSGADIKEINTVRKHLSNVKGGQLAKAAHPAHLVSLILSDVVSDPLDVIASGPTVPDPTTFNDAIQVLEKYDLLSQIPLPLINHIKKGIGGFYPEPPKPGDSVFNNTNNIIIGSNNIALEAASQKAKTMGLHSIIVTSSLEGDVIKIAEQLIDTALKFQSDVVIKKPCCLLFGGETTIKVNGSGTGGRNQHIALYAALLLNNKTGITFLSGGTDGSDGPTSAAGAVVDSKTVEHAESIGIDSRKYLNDFDSFHFFEKAGGHIITGATMTNVMDVIVIIIE
jgi:glycerate 2-kinase